MHVGDVVLVRASVNDVGRTSIEVGVRVEAEEILSGRRTHTSSAYLVFVALDERGQPGRPVPGLAPENDLERHRQAEAKIRREHRLARPRPSGAGATSSTRELATGPAAWTGR